MAEPIESKPIRDLVAQLNTYLPQCSYNGFSVRTAEGQVIADSYYIDDADGYIVLILADVPPVPQT